MSTIFPRGGGGDTHIFGQTGMCRSNGLLLYKKSLNMGPIFYQKILKHGSTLEATGWLYFSGRLIVSHTLNWMTLMGGYRGMMIKHHDKTKQQYNQLKNMIQWHVFLSDPKHYSPTCIHWTYHMHPDFCKNTSNWIKNSGNPLKLHAV